MTNSKAPEAGLTFYRIERTDKKGVSRLSKPYDRLSNAKAAVTQERKREERRGYRGTRKWSVLRYTAPQPEVAYTQELEA